MARFDLHVQALPIAEQRMTTKIFSLGYAQPLAVKGFQMLINIWLKIFFTRQGSDPTNLERGTGFTNLIGSTVSVADAEDIVRTCITQCNAQVTALQTNDYSLTASERFANAVLLRYVPDPTAPGFDMFVEITNVAGERLSLNIPDYTR